VASNKAMQHLGGQHPGVCKTSMMTDVFWRGDLA